MIHRIRSRGTWLLAALALSLLVAAGCGGSDDDDGDTGGTGAAAGDTSGGGSSSGDVGKGVSLANCSKPEGEGQFTIVSDLPLQGSSRLQTTQMVEAIKKVMADADYKAGDYTVQYQSCDDATSQAGKWDSAVCSANANAYSRAEDVVGVVGTFNSGCAQIIIPVLNRAPGGSIAMVSPANTYVGLTHKRQGTAAGEPDKYYPTGKRNYIRVVAADDYQGAAQALLAKELGVKKVFILNDKESYGAGVAANFRDAVKRVGGMQVVGYTAWDPKASNYQSLMQQIAATKADAVFLGGLIDENGGQVIKDKVAVLGPNTKVKLLAPDGFTTTATLTGSGSGGKAAEGMYLSVAGVPPDELEGAGKEFVDSFKEEKGLDAIEPYTAYAAQSAQALLDAISRSDGTRQSITDELLKTKVDSGILGSFSINENGDTDANPVTIFVAKGGKLVTHKVITPDPEIVATDVQ